jgi:hypothetical protein
MTPVIVLGLAANKVSGVRDRFSAAPSFEESLACEELPRNMENPIQVSTPPPAIEKASRDAENLQHSCSRQCGYEQNDQHGQCRLGGISYSYGARLTGLDLREHDPAD